MYITLIGRVDEVNDSSYERTVNRGKSDEHQEAVTQFELQLSIPGMQDRLRVTLPADVAPTQAIMDKWEMEEQWVTVTADTMRTLTGETDGRAWALISFAATEVKEVTQQERQQLQDARKTAKAKKKAARAKAKADRAAAKAAGSTPDKSSGKPAA